MALTGRTIYDWVHDFTRRARAAGDVERQRLWTLHCEAWDVEETEPGRALSLIEEGRTLAQTLGEAWWVVFFMHRRVLVLLHNARDYRVALNAAVRAVVEARKPIYNGCPQQLLIHIDLINVHIEVDAMGYRAAVEDALTFVSSQTDLYDDHLFEIQELRITFELELEHWEKAHEAAQLYFDLVSQATLDLDFHMASAYAYLCFTTYHLKDWGQLKEHAQNGEVYARRKNQRMLTLGLQMWQALSLHHEGKLDESKRLSRLAADQMARMADYSAAYAALREARGEWRDVLDSRDRQLANWKNQGCNSALARCHFERCRLLSEMGELSRADVDAARQAMQQLIDPSLMLAKLNKLRIEYSNE